MIYLFSAFAVTWLLIFIYILSLSAKQKILDEEIRTLRKIIEQKK